MLQVSKIWDEYKSQDGGGMKHMISNAHGSEVKHHGKDASYQLPSYDADAINNSSAITKFRDRQDMNGNTVAFDDVLSKIVAINTDTHGAATIRQLAGELLRQHNILVPRATLGRILVDHKFIFHKDYIKPLLSERNRLNRCMFAYSKIDFDIPLITVDGEEYFTMRDRTRNEVFLDEKWYFVDKIAEVQRRQDSEPKPATRRVYKKSQAAIPRIMFLVAMSNPRVISPSCCCRCCSNIVALATEDLALFSICALLSSALLPSKRHLGYTSPFLSSGMPRQDSSFRWKDRMLALYGA